MAPEAKEQKTPSEQFREALDKRNYVLARRISNRMEDCMVCFYTSHHLDYLVAEKEYDDARKVVAMLGRSLDVYLLKVHGINGRNKPYKQQK